MDNFLKIENKGKITIVNIKHIQDAHCDENECTIRFKHGQIKCEKKEDTYCYIHMKSFMSHMRRMNSNN